MRVEELKRSKHESFDIIWPVPAQLLPKQLVHVDFNPRKYNCKTNDVIQAQTNTIWDEKVQSNPRCYDAPKFRQAGLHIVDGKVIIEVGLSSYAEVCGTNLSERCNEYRAKGAAEFGDDTAYLSNALGGGVLLLTADGYVVVGRRASWVCEFQGFLDRPGGHAETVNVPALKNKTHLASPEIDTDLQQAVMDEIWSFPCQEAEAEYGIGPELMQDYGFLGTVLCKVDTCRPSLEFYARLSITSSEVRTLYNKGTQVEADETSGIHLIDPDTLVCLLHLLNGKQPDSCQCYQREELRGDQNECHKQAANMIHETTPALLGALVLATDIISKKIHVNVLREKH